MAFLQKLDEYFDATTVHGLSYIKSGNSIWTRLLWLGIVITGFTVAGILIYDLLVDWDENPYLITLGSVQAPISEVQFPTVTICEESNGPVENWAYPEKVLNALEYECYAPPDWYADYGVEPKYPSCNGTAQQLRQDLSDLPKTIWRIFRDAILNGNKKFVPTDTALNDTEISMVLKLVSKDPDLLNAVEAIVVDNFARADSFEEVLLQIWTENGGDPALSGIDIANVSENVTVEAEAFFTAAKIMLSSQRQNIPLGNLVSMFEKNLLPSSEDCQFTPIELKLQGILADFAKALGLDAEHNVSLYDIPNMVSYFPVERMGDRSIEEQFWFSRCQQEPSQMYDSIDHYMCFTDWRDFIADGEAHPCDKDEKWSGDFCCHKFTKILKQDLKLIMEIMRMTSKTPQTIFDPGDMLEPFWNNSNIRYSMNDVNHGYYKQKRDSNYDSVSFVKGCSYTGRPSETFKEDTKCFLFQPSVTDMGICHSFNSLSLEEVLKASYFKDVLTSVYEKDINGNKTELKRGVGSGPTLGLKLVLYNTPLLKPPRYVPTRHGEIRRKTVPLTSFSMGINSAYDLSQMIASGKRLRTGFKTTFEVIPSELVPMESLLGIPVDKRNCLFKNEGDGYIEFFKVYSQAACQFECIAKLATSICRCTPWNIPFVGNSKSHTICDLFGNTCYNAVLKQQYRKEDCNCPPDCGNVQYTVLTKEEEIHPREYCSGNLASLSTKAFQDVFWRGYNDLFYALHNLELGSEAYPIDPRKTVVSRLDPLRTDLCEKYVKDSISEVSIQFGSHRYSRTIMDKRVTFSDQLGSLGGTLGLFTGMSILSMVEAIFWFLKIVKGVICPQK